MAEKAVYEDKILEWKTHPEHRVLLSKLSRPILGKYRKFLLKFGHYIITLKNGEPVALLCYNIVQHKKHYGKPVAQIEFYNLEQKKGQMHYQRLIDKMREIHPDIKMIYGRVKVAGLKLLNDYAKDRNLKFRKLPLKGKQDEFLFSTARDAFVRLPKINHLKVK